MAATRSSAKTLTLVIESAVARVSYPVPYAIGIDPGVHRCAVAVYGRRGLVALDTWPTAPWELADFARPFFWQTPGLVVVESQFMRHPQALELAAVRGRLEALAVAGGRPVAGVAAATWQSLALRRDGDKGRLKRDQLKTRAMARAMALVADAGLDCELDSDLSDAACIAETVWRVMEGKNADED